ncbi:MAG: BMP family ABC transporter substrate-binding protein [Clostridiales bacterium]|nr:BMP family ABC transporter substrate-binding protein [Clostridiales bacterium]
MRKKIRILIAVALLATALFTTGCDKKETVEETNTPTPVKAQTPEPTEELQRETITIGLAFSGTDDVVQLHNLQIDTIEIENTDITVVKKETSQATLDADIEELSQKECKIIFVVDVEESGIKQIAGQYPEIKFELFGGLDAEDANNLSLYDVRYYQQQYINGMIAGYMTQTDSIGYIGLRADDKNIRQVNAFALGVSTVNKEAEVNFVLLSADATSQQTEEVAFGLAEINCDIIMQRNIASIVLEIAMQEDILMIGNGYTSESVVNIDEPNYANYMTQQTHSIIEGRYVAFDASTGWLGFESDIFSTEMNLEMLNIQQQQSVAQKIQQMKDKQWDVFAGPIKDMYGTTIISEGMQLPDVDLRYMLWYVENIIATAPPAG